MRLIPPTAPVSKVSPLLSEADGVWNMGESPSGRDLGGVLTRDDPSLAVQPTYIPLLPGGWANLTGLPPLVHFVGSFRPPGVLGPGDESRASFEVVAPTTIDTPRVVVAIFTQATFGGESLLFPHVYPGDPNYHDLYVTGGVGPHVDVVARNLNRSPVPPYRVLGVQFVPRTSQRPMVSAMQRLRQVRYAVLHLLQQRYGIGAADVAFAVDCASFGGFTAQVALSFYPTEFHAGVAGSYSAAHRSMPSDFDSFVFFSSGLGSNFAGNSYLSRDTVEIPMWCHIEGTDFASVSSTNRWFLGHLQRPIYFLVGDEDTVTHGTDWVSILAGSSGLTQAQSGWIQGRPNVLGRPVDVLWSVVSKSSHGEPRPNVFTLRGVTPSVDTDDLSKPLEVMLEWAYAELSRTGIPPVVSIDHPQIGRKLVAPNLPSLDPSRAALTHKGIRTFTNGSIPGLLTENPTFRRYGQGTWLGANESLKVRKINGQSKASVFVGSADGYVTRLTVENRGSAPVIQPLVEQARTNIAGVPYALGHGTWGLDVGDIDDTLPGDEVVVSSYNRVGLFAADTLARIREVTLPDWEYDNPRKLQVADLFTTGGAAIVFRTLHGHLVIMDKMLTRRYEHHEGGIVDLVVGPQPAQPAGSWLKRPIYVLSARGHIVRLEIDATPQATPGPMQARLAGASHLEYGGMRDLDLMPWNGATRLAGLFVPQLGETDAVRFFSPLDCGKVGEFGDLTRDPPPPPPPPVMPPEPTSAGHQDPSGSQEPSFAYLAGHGGDRYLINSGGSVSIWDGYMVLGHKTLASYLPALNDAAVEAGDVDPTTPGDEVVVATTTGKLIWFKLAELTSPTKTITAPDFDRSAVGHFYLDPTSGEVFEHRSNMSLAGTWSMVATPASGGTSGRLEVIDAAGGWWRVSPSGVPAWRGDVPGYRSLAGAAASSVPAPAAGGSAERAWSFLSILGSDYLLSTPYLPVNGEVPSGPWWLPPGIEHQPVIRFRDGHWLLPGGGVRRFDAATDRHWCAWWQRSPTQYANLIQCATYKVAGGMVDPATFSIWGSTQAALPNGAPPPRWPPSSQGHLPPLRTETNKVDLHSMQTIAIGRVLPGRDEPQVVAAAMGGRVMVLDGTNGRILVESQDYGLGGMALALADLTNDGLDEIIFAPLYSPIAHSGGSVRANLLVISGATGTLNLLSSVPVGIQGNDDFLGYGACGIAVADLPGQSISKAIFVTTLNGELAVFGHNNGILNQTLFRTVVDGSLGAFNSIVIENLESDVNSKPEVYIGGSAGLRRWDFQ